MNPGLTLYVYPGSRCQLPRFKKWEVPKLDDDKPLRNKANGEFLVGSQPVKVQWWRWTSSGYIFTENCL